MCESDRVSHLRDICVSTLHLSADKPSWAGAEGICMWAGSFFKKRGQREARFHKTLTWNEEILLSKSKPVLLKGRREHLMERRGPADIYLHSSSLVSLLCGHCDSESVTSRGQRGEADISFSDQTIHPSISYTTYSFEGRGVDEANPSWRWVRLICLVLVHRLIETNVSAVTHLVFLLACCHHLRWDWLLCWCLKCVEKSWFQSWSSSVTIKNAWQTARQ